MSNEKSKWLTLAEACEKAKKPDRNLDSRIHYVAGDPRKMVAPFYTRSLDAAEWLRVIIAPEWGIDAVVPAVGKRSYGTCRANVFKGERLYTANAATEPLARVAAALRARAAMEDTK